MEWKELENSWKSLDQRARRESFPSTRKLNQMVRSNYRRRLQRVFLPEILATLACWYFVVLFLYKFHLLETTFLQVMGMASIIILAGLPLIRLLALRRLVAVGRLDRPHGEVLSEFLRRKITFQRLQLVVLGLTFPLLMAISVLSVRVYGEYDVTSSKYFWAIVFTLGGIFSQLFWYKIKRYYDKKIRDAEALLREIQ